MFLLIKIKCSTICIEIENRRSVLSAIDLELSGSFVILTFFILIHICIWLVLASILSANLIF